MLEIPRESGSQKLKLLKESMKLNWNFQRGGVGVSKQKLFMGELIRGGMDISRTTC